MTVKRPAKAKANSGKPSVQGSVGGVAPRPSTGVKARSKASAPRTISIFVSYSHKDRGAQEQLDTHLAALRRDGVSVWFDGDLDAGAALDPGIAKALRQAQVFVALFSPDYINSRYCWDVEYKRAMNRRARGTLRVVGVVVRPCLWKATRAAGFKLLPEDGKAVTRWRSADEAYVNVAEGLHKLVKAIRAETPAQKRLSTTKKMLPPGTKAPNKPVKAKAGSKQVLGKQPAGTGQATRKGRSR